VTNIVMLVKDRSRLTEQCLRTLYANTRQDEFNLTIVDDGSQSETGHIVAGYARRGNCNVIHIGGSVGIVGWLRNIGIQMSERYFGRGEWLYLSDNDLAYRNGWLPRMISGIFGEIAVLGGYRHPFHGINDTIGVHDGHAYYQSLGTVIPQQCTHGIYLTDAVAGYSQLMDWRTWDKYGPFDQHAKGVCQSEDFAFCQKVTKGNQSVGYIYPPTIANCGITNSEGKPAIGSESFPRYEGLIYE
jgi:glycosyltransferase involved in cell wall biosynthesis